MIQTREIKIESKIFRKNDIHLIWKILNNHHSLSKQGENHTSLRMQIRCEDDTRYESEVDDLLVDGGVFDLKKIMSIDCEYSDYRNNKAIHLVIECGTDTYNNYLTVKGSDENWVSGNFDKLKIIYDSISPQKSWVNKHKNFLTTVGTIIFAHTYNYLYFLFFLSDAISTKNFIVYYLINMLGSLPISIVISWRLTSWLIKLWPNIEFDFGPEHTKTEKSRRMRLGIFWSAYILPILFLLLPFMFQW